VPCKRSLLNTSTVAENDASIVWAEVIDPREPLFGRRFRVERISHGLESSAVVFVQYKGDLQLRLPLRATNLSTLSHDLPLVTLTRGSVEEFLSLVKEYEACQRLPTRSGRHSARRTKKMLRKQ
jgi:hypothetical protein